MRFDALTAYEIKYLSAGAEYARGHETNPPVYACAVDGVPAKEREAELFWEGYENAKEEMNNYANWQPC